MDFVPIGRAASRFVLEKVEEISTRNASAAAENKLVAAATRDFPFTPGLIQKQTGQALSNAEYDRFARELSEVGSKFDIKTRDPLRALIRIDGYGAQPSDALEMEKVIAAARNNFETGKIGSAVQLEKEIATGYFDLVRPGKLAVGDIRTVIDDAIEKPSRGYSTATLMPRHVSYASRVDALTSSSTPEHQFSATINGRSLNFAAVKDNSQWQGPGRVEHSFFELPDSKIPFSASAKFKEDLFKQLVESRQGSASKEMVGRNLERVAIIEWLNGQLWKYPRGSAGVSQLEGRTWLEIAGIDSGRFRAGIDPNLEALSSELKDYVTRYPNFFLKFPRSF